MTCGVISKVFYSSNSSTPDAIKVVPPVDPAPNAKIKFKGIAWCCAEKENDV